MNSNQTDKKLSQENQFLKKQLADADAKISALSDRLTHKEHSLTNLLKLTDAIVAHSPVPIILATPDARVMAINTTSRNQLGLSNVSIGMPLSDVEGRWQHFDTDDHLIAFDQLPLFKSLHGETVSQQEIRVVHDDGTETWEIASSSPIYDEDGNLMAAFLTFPDITERKLVETQLINSEMRYRNLFDTAGISIWDLDFSKVYRSINNLKLQGFIDFKDYLESEPEKTMSLIFKSRVINVNAQTLTLFDAESEKSFLKNLEKHFGEDLNQVFIQIIKAIWNEEKQFKQEANFVTLTGKKLRVIISFLLPAKASDFNSVAISTLDVTEYRQMEAQFRQSQKMEAIGILAGGIAHEFNNLLSPILGYTELFLSDRKESDPDFKGLQQIFIAGNRAKALIKQLLAYGRKSMSQKESIDLEKILHQAIELIKTTLPTNIKFKVKVDNKLPLAWGMPNEFHQVIINLCVNACHAMPEGGTLSFTLKLNSPEHKSNQRLSESQSYLCLTVNDTGVGISESDIEQIFDPFFTTKNIGEGSGLGLSVVQGIVEQHKGLIEVDSELGEGSTFRVFLPIAIEQTSESSETVASVISGNEHILLIDDEPMVLDLSKSMLEKLNYQVDQFLDPELALSEFEKKPASYDCAIIDYGMPKMNGKELAKKLKKIRSDLPIILATGYADLISEEDIKTWGMETVLLKPYKLSDLSTSVRSVLSLS